MHWHGAFLRKETTMNFIEYVKQLWKNGPSGGTPWSASRLNHMEEGIKANNEMISELNSNIIETMGNNGISSRNSINMDSELFSSHKPLYIHAITTQNPSSIAGMPQGAYGYGVLITLLSKHESPWASCQIYIPHGGEVSRDIYVRTFGDTYKGKPSWRRIGATQIEATQ